MKAQLSPVRLQQTAEKKGVCYSFISGRFVLDDNLAWEGAILKMRRAGTGDMGNTCRSEWPHQPQEQLGAVSRTGETVLLTVAMGSGTGFPRAREGCPNIPRVGMPCGWADFWEPPSSTHMWHVSAVAIGRQKRPCRAEKRAGRVRWGCEVGEMSFGSSFAPHQVLSSAHFLNFLPYSSLQGQPLFQSLYQFC